jgi:acylphosphatase
MNAAIVNFRGEVQRCGFRREVEEICFRHQLRGIVWNLVDQSEEVRLIVQGGQIGVDYALKLLRVEMVSDSVEMIEERLQLTDEFLPTPVQRLPNNPKEERDRWDDGILILTDIRDNIRVIRKDTAYLIKQTDHLVE